MVKSKRTKATDFIIAFICFLLILICLLPMMNILARSLSSRMALVNKEVAFLPVGFTLDSYSYVLSDANFTRSLVWTAELTVICTVVSMVMTMLCAYPLTYDNLKGRRVINGIIIFTMFFNAGTIPNYILMDNLGLINNPLVLIIPNCLSVWNVIIMRSFLFSIPESLRESAELDGANPFRVLVSIYIPLSMPVIATLSLFYAVGRWNGFADALMYISIPKWQPIQLKLYNIINNFSAIETSKNDGFAQANAGDGLKAAAIMFATLPIVIIYPWLQRYFISGVTIGAVKG